MDLGLAFFTEEFEVVRTIVFPLGGMYLKGLAYVLDVPLLPSCVSLKLDSPILGPILFFTFPLSFILEDMGMFYLVVPL